jgi:hypothetical protein
LVDIEGHGVGVPIDRYGGRLVAACEERIVFVEGTAIEVEVRGGKVGCIARDRAVGSGKEIC